MIICYQEARALLGRIEHQKGNLDAALQLFQGIDITGLTPRMITAISERARPRKRSKGDTSLVGVMSWHSVSLLLEAILLKSKVLEELGKMSGTFPMVPFRCIDESFTKCIALTKCL